MAVLNSCKDKIKSTGSDEIKSLAFIFGECIGTEHVECLISLSRAFDFQGECGECRSGSVGRGWAAS
jgi:hypothetical protein